MRWIKTIFAVSLAMGVLGPAWAQTEAGIDTIRQRNAAVDELYRQGHYGDAVDLAEDTLKTAERVLGPEHPDTLNSVNNLALLYRSQGRSGEAEPLYRRALEGRERVLGPEHPDTLRSVDNLADLYGSQRRFSEAEPLYQRALAIYEKVLGPEHPAVARSLNGLAKLYAAQGRSGEAEPLYRRALLILKPPLVRATLSPKPSNGIWMPWLKAARHCRRLSCGSFRIARPRKSGCSLVILLIAMVERGLSSHRALSLLYSGQAIPR